MDVLWILIKRMEKFLLLKMKLLAAGENGGGHHSKFDADGHCSNGLGTLPWNLDGYLIE